MTSNIDFMPLSEKEKAIYLYGAMFGISCYPMFAHKKLLTEPCLHETEVINFKGFSKFIGEKLNGTKD